MPVIKCKRPKQNFQTPVYFSMAAQSKTTFYLFTGMLYYKFMHIQMAKRMGWQSGF